MQKQNFYTSHFFIFYYLYYLGRALLGPKGAGLGPAALIKLHACSNYAKVIKLPSHSSYICTIPNKNEERMRTAYLLLKITRRLAARWFRSRLCMIAPFCFPFVSVMMKVTACCLGSSFFRFAGGNLRRRWR